MENGKWKITPPLKAPPLRQGRMGGWSKLRSAASPSSAQRAGDVCLRAERAERAEKDNKENSSPKVGEVVRSTRGVCRRLTVVGRRST